LSQLLSGGDLGQRRGKGKRGGEERPVLGYDFGKKKKKGAVSRSAEKKRKGERGEGRKNGQHGGVQIVGGRGNGRKRDRIRPSPYDEKKKRRKERHTLL